MLDFVCRSLYKYYTDIQISIFNFLLIYKCFLFISCSNNLTTEHYGIFTTLTARKAFTNKAFSFAKLYVSQYQIPVKILPNDLRNLPL